MRRVGVAHLRRRTDRVATAPRASRRQRRPPPADRSSPTKASIARYRPTEAMRRVRRRPRLVAALTGPPNSTCRRSTRASRRTLQSAVKLNPSWQPPLLAYTHASVLKILAAQCESGRAVAQTTSSTRREKWRGERARATLLAREVSEHARRRRGVVEEARGEEMRSGADVSCDETSDILARIDFFGLKCREHHHAAPR